MTIAHSGGDNLILIGYRGSGKTCVGRQIAAVTGRAFVDTDDLIETAAGRTISRIFESDGESEFRRLEAEAIRSVAARSRQVISVGGGAVLSEQNRAALRTAGLCVWLRASPDVLWRRIEPDEQNAARRPALTAAPGADEVRQLLADRQQYYAELAHESLDTDSLDVSQAAERIIEMMPGSSHRHGA